jgi:formate-dependent nitrite reductase membrane component NrfD
MYLAAEHFVRAPDWTWFILGYFFLAGLSGGAYVVGTLLRLSGDPRDEPAARVAFYASFVLIPLCPVFLTADLGVSWTKFWHMLVNTTPGSPGLNFKYWSPISVGVWVLVIFSFFATVSAIAAWLGDRRGVATRPAGPLSIAFNVVGAIVGLFFASYTGVLLSVSNQPVWSDTWMLGGLFLASGLSGAAALVVLLTRYRPDSAFSVLRIRIADGYFSLLELVLIVAFFVTIASAGATARALTTAPLWALALVGLAASLVGLRGESRRVQASAGGGAAVASAGLDAVLASILVLVGVLALRAAIIFSAQ